MRYIHLALLARCCSLALASRGTRGMPERGEPAQAEEHGQDAHKHTICTGCVGHATSGFKFKVGIPIASPGTGSSG